jgi:ABC-2 type transport system permease protein
VIFSVAMGRGGRVVLGRQLRYIRCAGPDHDGHDAERVRQLELLAARRQAQGTIVDLLMPPLTEAELLIGIVGAAMTRRSWSAARWRWRWRCGRDRHDGGASVGDRVVRADGLADAVADGAADQPVGREVRPRRGGDQLRGRAAVAALGHVLRDHNLAPAFQAISRANPFFYMISGFRFGFIGESDIGNTNAR